MYCDKKFQTGWDFPNISLKILRHKKINGSSYPPPHVSSAASEMPANQPACHLWHIIPVIRLGMLK